jgi:molybdopterin-guanine dinucleotide biosynthesis protein A
MLDAILAALPHAEGVHPDRVWVTWCDQLAVRDDTLDDLVREESQAPEPALVMPTHTGVDPYIHFARGDGGRITRVLHRREGDAMPPSGESDIGLFSLSTPAFLDRLVEFAAAAEHGPRTGERNFLPFIPWLAHRAPVVTFPCHDPIEALGINTPEDLARVEAYLAARDPAARR